MNVRFPRRWFVIAAVAAALVLFAWLPRTTELRSPVESGAKVAAASPTTGTGASIGAERGREIDPPRSTREGARAAGPEDEARRDPRTQRPAVRRGFRATSEQRKADLAAFLAAENLVALRDEWQQRAAQGDADAASRLRDLYDECARALFGVEAMARGEHYPWAPPTFPVDSPERQASLAIGRQRCDGIAAASDSLSAARELLRPAQAMESLAAELRGETGVGRMPLDPGERVRWWRGRAARRLAEGSAEAILGIALNGDDGGTRFLSEAWILAACELGYPCAASHGFVRNWCLDYGEMCAADGLLDYAHYTSSPRRWRLARVQRDEILRLLRAGDLEALLLPEGAPGGGR